ncbi:MAG: hypothetical protein ACE10D_06125 [Planctomycetota bacterium]|nr:hypothetical protein [Planctomycetota bacterium]
MKRLILILLLVTLTVGCRGRFMVTDPVTQNVYYTTRVHKKLGGAVKFKDARSGQRVTLQNSQVKKLTKGEWVRALAE